MRRAALAISALLAGCYDVGSLSKHYVGDGGVDHGVVDVPDGGQGTSVSVYAGTPGGAGSAGGKGTQAFFDNPEGLAMDDKSFYVIDGTAETISAIDRATFSVTRISGVPWHSGRDATHLNQPLYAAVLGGAIYVSEPGNNAVRKLANGMLSDVAGDGGYGDCGGPLSTSRVAGPAGISTDGNVLYLANEDGNTICELDPNLGTSTLLAGSSAAGGYGFTEGVPGPQSRFESPTSVIPVTLKGTAGLLISDLNNRVLRLYDPGTTVVTTYAGTPQSACDFATGPPLIDGASLCGAWQLDTDGQKIYFTEDYAQAIVSIDPSAPMPTSFTVIAGGAQGGFADGVGSTAQFSMPRGLLSFTGAGGTQLLVADRDNHAIRQVDVASGTVTTVAGSPEHRGNTDGDRTTAARFAVPDGLATDGTTLYVADSGNGRVRAITGTTVSSLDPTPSTPGLAFTTPVALAYAPDGSLYVVDEAQNEVFRVTSLGANPQLALFVGNAPDADGGTTEDGGFSSVLAAPQGIAVDDTTVYVADTGHDTVRTFALDGTLSGRVDLGIDGLGTVGCGTGLGLSAPTGLALDRAGHTLYVAARDNCIIYAYDTVAKTAKALAGSTRGSADGVGGAASFDAPTGLALDGLGNLFVVDSANATVRRVELASSVVSTYAGTVYEAGIQPGPAPAQLNRGFGAAWLPGQGLVVSMPSENALVLIQ